MRIKRTRMVFYFDLNEVPIEEDDSLDGVPRDANENLPEEKMHQGEQVQPKIVATASVVVVEVEHSSEACVLMGADNESDTGIDQKMLVETEEVAEIGIDEKLLVETEVADIGIYEKMESGAKPKVAINHADKKRENMSAKRKREEKASSVPVSTCKVSKVAVCSVKNSQPAIRAKQRSNQDELAGFIFVCNEFTKDDCYKYGVFGLRSEREHVLAKIKQNMILFLFNYSTKSLHGVYCAASDGGLELEPNAFKGNFPVQVRFKVFVECKPLPEIAMKDVIRDNYRGNSFKPELNGVQVDRLIRLFTPPSQNVMPPLKVLPPPNSAASFYSHNRSLTHPFLKRADWVRIANAASTPLPFAKSLHVSARLPSSLHMAADHVKLAAENRRQVAFCPRRMLPLGGLGFGGKNASMPFVGAPPTRYLPHVGAPPTRYRRSMW